MRKGKKFLSRFGLITALFAAGGILLLAGYLSPFPAWAGGLAGGSGLMSTITTIDRVKCEGKCVTCKEEAGGAASWETYKAPKSGCLLISTEGQNFDSILWVYKGPEGRDPQDWSDLTRVACDEDCGANNTSKVIISAQEGVNYYIAMDDQTAKGTSAKASKTFVEGVPKKTKTTTTKTETANRPVAEPGENFIRLAE